MNKGFTLVEILAVIAILSLIMIITIPTVMKTRGNIENTLSQEEKKNIEESGRLLGVDLDDPYSDIFNCAKGWIKEESGANCEISNSSWSKLSVDLSLLQSHDYYRDDQNRCKGTITITKSASSYVVDSSNVTCE